MLTPAVATAAPKKLKILLLSIRLLTLALAAVPEPIKPLVGKFAPAGPMLLFEIMLLLLPPATVLVLNKMLPPAVAAVALDEPSTVQFVIVLFCAPLMRRIVLVLAVVETVV